MRFVAALIICLFAIPTAEARTRHSHQPYAQAGVPFDRHAIHIGSEALPGQTYRKRVRHAGWKQMRKKRELRQQRQRAARTATRSTTRSTPAAPKPGTLGAYRKVIEAATVGPLMTQGLGNIQGLQGHFLKSLAALRSAMPPGLGFSVGSGFRSWAEQARLHALKPRLAARPGRSNHERGLAGDLRFASRESKRWVHRHSHKHGLRFPMSYEPWHIEPAGATRFARSMKRTRYASVR